MNPIAAGDRRTEVREAVSQEVSRRTREDGTDGREENSQGRGIQVPKKQNSQEWDQFIQARVEHPCW